jgi:hypothetical protein
MGLVCFVLVTCCYVATTGDTPSKTHPASAVFALSYICVHGRKYCMCVCMCVCMYVCMCVCMYVCMHVCVYVCVHVCVCLQDTVAEMAKDIAKKKGMSADADDLFKFIEKVRTCMSCAVRASHVSQRKGSPPSIITHTMTA